MTASYAVTLTRTFKGHKLSDERVRVLANSDVEAKYNALDMLPATDGLEYLVTHVQKMI